MTCRHYLMRLIILFVNCFGKKHCQLSITYFLIKVHAGTYANLTPSHSCKNNLKRPNVRQLVTQNIHWWALSFDENTFFMHICTCEHLVHFVRQRQQFVSQIQRDTFRRKPTDPVKRKHINQTGTGADEDDFPSINSTASALVCLSFLSYFVTWKKAVMGFGVTAVGR